MRQVAKIPDQGTVLGEQFVLGREIGRGGVGVVFEADQLGLARKVAVKMLLPQATAVDGLLERFEREAQLSSSLTSANTIRIYAFDVYGETPKTAGLPYMVMELLSGETLGDYLVRRGRLGETETIDLLLQVLDSLCEAHGKGVIHRDVKPENIYLCTSPRGTLVKVLDFGIAKTVQGGLGTLSRRLTATGMIFGTPLYMAPEQVTGEALITPALDVYGLGCIAYHMLSGAPPYEGENGLQVGLMHLSDPIPRLGGRFASPRLAAIVYRCMAKDPEARYPDASALRDALLAYQQDEPELDVSPSPVPTADFPALDPSGADVFGLGTHRETLEWQSRAIQDLAERIGTEAANYMGPEVETLPEMPKLLKPTNPPPAGDAWPSAGDVGDDPVDTYVEMPRFRKPVGYGSPSVSEPVGDWVDASIESPPDGYDDAPSTLDTGDQTPASPQQSRFRRITPLAALPATEPDTVPGVALPFDEPPRPEPVTEPSLPKVSNVKRNLILIFLALMALAAAVSALVAKLWLWP